MNPFQRKFAAVLEDYPDGPIIGLTVQGPVVQAPIIDGPQIAVGVTTWEWIQSGVRTDHTWSDLSTAEFNEI